MPVPLKSSSKPGLRIAWVGEGVQTELLEVDVTATVLVVAAAGELVVAGAITILDVEAAEVLVTTEFKGVDVISTAGALVGTAALVLLELAAGRVLTGFVEEDVLTGVMTVGVLMETIVDRLALDEVDGTLTDMLTDGSPMLVTETGDTVELAGGGVLMLVTEELNEKLDELVERIDKDETLS